MADNKNKTERLHDELPKYYKSRVNPNWKALVEALGESDQNIADLVEEVRKQFFVKTASRPYLDRLGANFSVSRPRMVGMQDEDFRRYIPVVAYQPKQVKLILDTLLDIFFFKQSTTAYDESQEGENFALENGWELEYRVDQINSELIKFNTQDFTNINAATADEVVSAINRQAQFSFAVVLDDRIAKRKVIRLFTKTIGSKGSLQIVGGRANIALKFSGFNLDAGSSIGVQWTVTKIGDTVTFQHVGGSSPNLNKVRVGDIAVIDMTGNSGSFVITSVDVNSGKFSFVNLFATIGTFTNGASDHVKFLSPLKQVIFTRENRAAVWEVSPGQIIVEMPASPPVVKRSLVGSAHFNGMSSALTDTISSSSIELADAGEWPLNGGKFVIQELEEIQTHILTVSEDITITKQNNTRLDSTAVYSYTSKSGNTLTGITPPVPVESGIFEHVVASATRLAHTVTVTTSTAHGFAVGEIVCAQNSVGDTTINGSYHIVSIPNPTTFTYSSFGVNGTNTGGLARVERVGLAPSGSIALLTSAQIDTGLYGPYMWDLDAGFVLSSLTTEIQDEIKAGNNVRTLAISSVNNIENTESFAIFDFGTEFEEGPVRILYKPATDSVQLDPAYVFKNNHEIGSSLTVIRRRGGIIMQGLGRERAAYVTDPAVARVILQDLMLKVKSVGIFIEFLVRYPQQVYSVLDVYESGSDSLWPVGQL